MQGDAPEGFINLSIRMQAPQMSQVQTKAVDPDGGGVQHIILYCFDAYGLFITTTTLDGDSHNPDATNPSLSGTFRATVPDYTSVVHIVGNQNLAGFQEDNYRNKSEYEVMSALEASGGRMIYWARQTVEELKLKQQTSEPVTLIRNQAKVTVESNDINFTLEGFVVTNTSAFGTVAPYNHQTGRFEAPTTAAPFVTIPENKSKLGDFMDVRGNMNEYVFETVNPIDDPVNVIIRGRYNGQTSKYYRVVLMDEGGNQMMILRNHHYKVTINDVLSYGQDNFTDALTAAATNNVWLTVEDSVSEIYGLDYILSVDQTSVVVDSSEFSSPNIHTLYYTVKKVDGSAMTQADKPEVTWMEGNTVAYNNFIHDFVPSTGRGTITVTLYNMGGQTQREGTLMIKVGRLYRKINVTTIKKLSFTPAWASTQVYGHKTGEHLTLMFTIPEDCPEEFFPMEVLLSTNILDIRHEAGQDLPVRFVSDATSGDFYGEPNEWGYKYVYTATAPGKQRVYLENILEQTGGASTITIEAEHFDKLQKSFTFASTAANKAIIVHGLKSFSATLPADDPILYYLVPQKINAHIEFSTHVGELYDNPAEGPDGTVVSGGETKYVKYIQVGAKDEFLFYSRYLTHEEDPHECDFDFYPIQEELWGTGGRVFGYTKTQTYSGTNYGAAFHMLTNSSRSEEVVRMASNPNGQPSVTGTGVCNGDQYRSLIFELGNYRAFTFNTKIKRAGVEIGVEGDKTLQWDYKPGAVVELSFDLTSFIAEDGVEVDPFGTPFKVYIDAPMLELDPSANTSYPGKIYENPDVPGQFIYQVEATREDERRFGMNERKIIPFRVKDIVSAGSISVSSETEVVVYDQDKFKVVNKSINGTLKYRNGSVNNVPFEAFVVLERIRTYNRIGTVTIHNVDGSGKNNMEIRLRGEYQYPWYNDPVKIQYAKTENSGTIVYEKVYASLDELCEAAATGDIILEQAQ